MLLHSWLFHRHLEDDEDIIRVVHKHWLIGLKFLFWPTLVFLACWVFLYFAPFLSVFYGVSLVSVIVLVWWIRNFLDYYLDSWLITDHGIIDVEWHGWFHRQSARVLYSDLQGVSYEIQGIFATLLNYGTIGVEKISTGSSITMEYVPHPRTIEALILQRMELYLNAMNLRDSKQVQSLLSSVLAREMQMRDLRDEEAAE